MRFGRRKIDPDDAFRVDVVGSHGHYQVRINVVTDRSNVELFADPDLVHELADRLRGAAANAELRTREDWR